MVGFLEAGGRDENRKAEFVPKNNALFAGPQKGFIKNYFTFTKEELEAKEKQNNVKSAIINQKKYDTPKHVSKKPDPLQKREAKTFKVSKHKK